MYEAHPLYDGVGTFRFVGPFYKFPETPTGIRRAPVAMGEDNDCVYRDILGLSDDEYAALEAAGHISMDFDPSLP